MLHENPDTHSSSFNNALDIARFQLIHMPQNSPVYSIYFSRIQLLGLTSMKESVEETIHEMETANIVGRPLERDAIYQWLKSSSRKWGKLIKIRQRMLAKLEREENNREESYKIQDILDNLVDIHYKETSNPEHTFFLSDSKLAVYRYLRTALITRQSGRIPNLDESGI